MSLIMPMMSSEYILAIDPGTINFSYCLIHADSRKIHKWDVISIGRSTSDTYETTCTNLAKMFNELDLTKNPTNNVGSLIVVVEAQPRVNIKTLVMSGQVQMYFILEKLKDRLQPDYLSIKKVVGYHARNKLKYYEPQPNDEPLDLSALKNGYYKNKKTSKEHCKRVLVQQGETSWSKFLETHKKKDDLSDAMLMGLAYIKFIMKKPNGSQQTILQPIEDNPEKPEKNPKISLKICKGITVKGTACKYAAKKKSSYCKIHKKKS